MRMPVFCLLPRRSRLFLRLLFVAAHLRRLTFLLDETIETQKKEEHPGCEPPTLGVAS